ncbi:MAG: DUF2809 domain-containing protein [Verrucomicrobiota bacterium]
MVSRNRLILLLSVVVVIASGLASRKFPTLLPAALGKYPGDALWAAMIFLLLALLSPRTRPSHLALLAFIVCCLVEFSQLYQAGWLNHIRSTTLGHLVLGAGFSWADIEAYVVGVGIVVLVDTLLLRAKPTSANSRQPPG